MLFVKGTADWVGKTEGGLVVKYGRQAGADRHHCVLHAQNSSILTEVCLIKL